MKWLLIIPTMFVLVWSGEVEAKTTFYECAGTTYKLDKPINVRFRGKSGH